MDKVVQRGEKLEDTRQRAGEEGSEGTMICTMSHAPMAFCCEYMYNIKKT